MIAANELLELKQRMLIAAEAAHRLANADGEYLEMDADQYELVYAALVNLKVDCRRVLAELDILRGMFAERVGAFFMEVANAGDGNSRDGGAVVAGVPIEAAVGSGEEPRDDAAATGGRPNRSRAARKPRARSNTRRNSRRNSGDTGNVDAVAGSSAMDRSEEA